MIAAPALPVTSQEAVAAANALFARTQPAGFVLAGRRYVLSLSPAPQPFRPDLTLWLAADTASLRLSVAGLEAGALLDGLLPGHREGALPEALRLAALEVALDQALSLLEQAAGQTLVLAGYTGGTLPAGSPALSVPFSLIPETGGAPVTGRADFDAAALARLSARLLSLPRRTNPSWDRLVLALPLVMGGAALSVRDLGSLAAGDIIVLDKNPADSELTFTVPFAPGRGFVVRVDGERATVLDIRRTAVAETATTGNTQAGGDRVGNVDDVEIPLSFDLGEIVLTLSELRSVGPGHVFALTGDARRPVTIRAHGRKIGAGDLVQVDQRLGVRVLHLFGTGDE